MDMADKKIEPVAVNEAKTCDSTIFSRLEAAFVQQ